MIRIFAVINFNIPIETDIDTLMLFAHKEPNLLLQSICKAHVIQYFKWIMKGKYRKFILQCPFPNQKFKPYIFKISDLNDSGT